MQKLSSGITKNRKTFSKVELVFKDNDGYHWNLENIEKDLILIYFFSKIFKFTKINKNEKDFGLWIWLWWFVAYS